LGGFVVVGLCFVRSGGGLSGGGFGGLGGGFGWGRGSLCGLVCFVGGRGLCGVCVGLWGGGLESASQKRFGHQTMNRKKKGKKGSCFRGWPLTTHILRAKVGKGGKGSRGKIPSGKSPEVGGKEKCKGRRPRGKKGRTGPPTKKEKRQSEVNNDRKRTRHLVTKEATRKKGKGFFGVVLNLILRKGKGGGVLNERRLQKRNKKKKKRSSP